MRAKEMLTGTCVAGPFFSGAAGLWTQSAQRSTGIVATHTTERVYQNIQVRKGVAADQLIPAKQFITASLAVRYDFCHQENSFGEARQGNQDAGNLMRMIFAINKDNFDGHREVTCYACHRGEHQPVITPIISAEDGEFAAEEKMHHPEPKDASQPERTANS